MKIIFSFVAIAFLLFSCSVPEKKNVLNPVGVWESEIPWNNNTITLKILSDSMILFKAKKLFCPGTKYFVSVGKWHIEKDSFLVMEQYTNGEKFEVKDLFPELLKTQQDSANVIGLDVGARFLLTNDRIYDIEPNGTRSKNKIYVRK